MPRFVPCPFVYWTNISGGFPCTARLCPYHAIAVFAGKLRTDSTHRGLCPIWTLRGKEETGFENRAAPGQHAASEQTRMSEARLGSCAVQHGDLQPQDATEMESTTT